jgi:anion-transporting  ArsA/GET3 family ATPase
MPSNITVNSVIAADSNGMMGSMMQDLAFAIPGVDEAMSFAEIMKYARSSHVLLTYSLTMLIDMSSRWNTP